MGRKRGKVKTRRTLKKRTNNQDIATDGSLLNTKKEQIELLEALFRHSDQNFLCDLFPGVSEEAVQIAIDKKLQQLRNDFQNKPSLVHWLHSETCEKNFVSMALLFIKLHEQHPEDAECNFKEIYHFLYELTTNRSPSHLSPDTARVLYDLVIEMIDEVWPDVQKDFLKYSCNIYQYSRPMMRRTYPGKKILPNRSTT